MGLLAPEEWERQVASQYQHVKRPLIASAFGKNDSRIPNGHLIMVASALPGEGKTFTSVNLALSMAREKDIEVLLVSPISPHTLSNRPVVLRPQAVVRIEIEAGLRRGIPVIASDGIHERDSTEDSKRILITSNDQR